MHMPSHMPCDIRALRTCYVITMQYACAMRMLFMCPRTCHAIHTRYAREGAADTRRHRREAAPSSQSDPNPIPIQFSKPAAGNGHLAGLVAKATGHEGLTSPAVRQSQATGTSLGAGAGREGLTGAAARRRRATRGLSREGTSDTRRHRREAAPSSQSEPGPRSSGGPADAGAGSCCSSAVAAALCEQVAAGRAAIAAGTASVPAAPLDVSSRGSRVAGWSAPSPSLPMPTMPVSTRPACARERPHPPCQYAPAPPTPISAGPVCDHKCPPPLCP